MQRTRLLRLLSASILLFTITFVIVLVGCGTGTKTSTTTTTNGGGTPGGSGGNSGGSGSGGGTGSGSGGGTGAGGSGGSTESAVTTETIASGLDVPWALAFAPDGRLFFTEQRGRLRVMVNGQVLPTPVYDKTSVSPGGESGMLGLALDPNFTANHRMYVFYCYNASSGIVCRVERLVESNNVATADKTLWEGPGGAHHEAGRVKFGPDGLLYVTYGDRYDDKQAQNMNDPAGSVLRMDVDGNPKGAGFPGTPYSLTKGHRDPQGIAFDVSGALYATEHGPTSNDEINLVQAGHNYGWPTCIGICNNPQFTDPIKLWNPETAAPSGATFYYGSQIPQWDGSMLIATMGLADNTYAHHLHRIKFDAPGGSKIVDEEVLFKDKFGRLRDVVEGPDGYIYFSTSNGGNADVIVRVKPK